MKEKRERQTNERTGQDNNNIHELSFGTVGILRFGFLNKMCVFIQAKVFSQLAPRLIICISKKTALNSGCSKTDKSALHMHQHILYFNISTL